MITTLTQLPTREWDVLVVGAGPAGSAASIALARQGLQVLQVDAKRFPRSKVCGGCLNVGSMQVVESLLGADHPLWEEANRLTRFRLLHRSRSFEFATPPGVAVERSRLDNSLLEAATAAGAVAVTPATAKLIERRDASWRVQLTHGDQHLEVNTPVVILASGLGGRAASTETMRRLGLQSTVHPSSRLGFDAILSSYPDAYSSGVIHMVVAEPGYVGLTVLADGRLHLAAAADRRQLQQSGPAALSQSILEEAGAPPLPADAQVEWRGTQPLTTKAERLAAEGVFLIGDAAGYVEPFTGEGIRWGLESGVGVAQFASEAVERWRPSLANAWQHWHHRHIAARQRTCRQISACLKNSTARWIAHQTLSFNPTVAHLVIRKLNQPSRIAQTIGSAPQQPRA